VSDLGHNQKKILTIICYGQNFNVLRTLAIIHRVLNNFNKSICSFNIVTANTCLNCLHIVTSITVVVSNEHSNTETLRKRCEDALQSPRSPCGGVYFEHAQKQTPRLGVCTAC